MSDGERKTVYCDNAATTLLGPGEIEAMNNWINRGNASAEYASAREARQMMDTFRHEIARAGGFALDGPNGYSVVFTSSGSESNCFIVTSVVRSYRAKTETLPHIIISAVEHKSLLACARQLRDEGLAQLSELPVGTSGPNLGAVNPADLRRMIQPNTCLVSVMAANNESGILNNLRALSAVAHERSVPFHTDAVQYFGKSTLRPLALGLDAYSASFHKIHGPPGVGLLVIKRSLIDGYSLCPLICGSQNGGMRGGTENLPGIGASLAAFRRVMADKDAPARTAALRDETKARIASVLPCFPLDAHPWRGAQVVRGITVVGGSPAAQKAVEAAKKAGPPVVFWLSPPTRSGAITASNVLPGMIFLSVYRPGFCNIAARDALEARGVIVSVGSACNTAAAAHASGVVLAMGVPEALRPGVLRISFSGDSTAEDVVALVRAFLDVVFSRECLSASASAPRKF